MRFENVFYRLTQDLHPPLSAKTALGSSANCPRFIWRPFQSAFRLTFELGSQVLCLAITARNASFSLALPRASCAFAVPSGTPSASAVF